MSGTGSLAARTRARDARGVRASAALGLALFLAVAGCAKKNQHVVVPTLPPANPQAVGKMVEGVSAAREHDGRERGIGLLEQAVSLDPKLWEARYDLGVLYAKKGDLAPAERELAQAAKLAPNAEDVVVALAEVRRRRGDAGGASEALGAFVKENPDAAVAGIALVAALRESGKIPEAIQQAQSVLARQSGNPYALAELALSYLELDEVDTAELLVEEALKADPKSAVAERTAGLVALKSGDDAVAFKHFAHAGELDPRDTTARLNIATVLLQAGVYERAAEEFRAVVEVEPDNTQATLGLAAARRAAGKRDDPGPFREAEKLLKGVLAREPKNLDATFNLALLYADDLHQPADAKPLFQRFLAEAPPSHPARAEAERELSGMSPPEAPAAAPAAPAAAPAPAKK
jgi:tetratricopeptide (TPR) repeat protein